MQLQYDNKFSEDATGILKSLGLNDLQTKFVIYHGKFKINGSLLIMMDALFEERDYKMDQLLYDFNHLKRTMKEENDAITELAHAEIDKLKEEEAEVQEKLKALKAKACAVATDYHTLTGNAMCIEHEVDEKSPAWKNAQEGWK